MMDFFDKIIVVLLSILIVLSVVALFVNGFNGYIISIFSLSMAYMLRVVGDAYHAKSEGGGK